MTYDPDDRIPRPARRLAGLLGAIVLGAFALAVGIVTWNVVGGATGQLLGPGTPPPVAEIVFAIRPPTG